MLVWMTEVGAAVWEDSILAASGSLMSKEVG